MYQRQKHQPPLLRKNCILWSHTKWLSSDERSAEWDIQRRKKCCDWKPGKLMSLHFYLLNLYGLLCQGLWGFSVPTLVIVFSLFAWKSDTFFSRNLGGIHLPTFFFSRMGKTRRPGKSRWIMNIAAVKLRLRWEKEPCLKTLQRGNISQLHSSCNAV